MTSIFNKSIAQPEEDFQNGIKTSKLIKKKVVRRLNLIVKK